MKESQIASILYVQTFIAEIN